MSGEGQTKLELRCGCLTGLAFVFLPIYVSLVFSLSLLVERILGMRRAYLKELAHLSCIKSQEKSLFRDCHGRLGAKLFTLCSSIKYLGV